MTQFNLDLFSIFPLYHFFTFNDGSKLHMHDLHSSFQNLSSARAVDASVTPNAVSAFCFPEKGLF